MFLLLPLQVPKLLEENSQHVDLRLAIDGPALEVLQVLQDFLHLLRHTQAVVVRLVLDDVLQQLDELHLHGMVVIRNQSLSLLLPHDLHQQQVDPLHSLVPLSFGGRLEVGLHFLHFEDWAFLKIPHFHLLLLLSPSEFYFTNVVDVSW